MQHFKAKSVMKSRVVIVGAGFAGVEAAKALARSNSSRSNQIEVVLIDRNNYHTFIPMLYQVATAVIYPQQIAYPIRRMFRGQDAVRFFQAEVTGIDFEQRSVQTSEGLQIDYQYLILATGSQSQYLGVPGAEEYAFPMRTLNDAVGLRNHLLSCLEQAVKLNDLEARQRWLRFVIVGGGPTGVELAGSLVQLISSALKRDFPTLDRSDTQIILVQSGEGLFKGYPERLGTYTARWLRRQGVQVYLKTGVSRVTPTNVHLDSANMDSSDQGHQADPWVIPTQTVIWTAGVEGAIPDPKPSLETTKRQQILAQPTLQVLTQPGVYAVGDLANIEGQSMNGVAQEAIQQGQTAARNILRQIEGKPPQPFDYHNKGRLAILGRHAGVAEIGRFAFGGIVAWLLWLEVHWWYLPGLRNRFGVLGNWLKYYCFGEGVNRIILSVPALEISSPENKFNTLKNHLIS
ncbi:MAG: NAD(P)/FAD-dependent oxidoreductase [Oscillatoriales cyanobacterium RM2_1_1]|nr:NAD(P)/FAD-dependent oxidoreductase [Oscillatoriales cyanobacterium SM2_3_0]NJO46998.1 NAD(P)/FAD-dependent oxidoreductase [Oscillatoriales cyanobacterium RM2_1_1]